MAENPDPTQSVVPEPEPEPDGVIEVDLQGKKERVAPVSVIAAERKRVKEAAEARVRQEYEPLAQKAALADQLQADLQAIKPHIEYLQQHPELLKPTDQHPSVSDEDAERYARKHQLYTASGLDLAAAKSIIAENRVEVQKLATQAAQQAIEPMRQVTAQQASRQNFVWAASQVGPDGHPLVNTKELAELWATFPHELTANPDVAPVILRAAIGDGVLNQRGVKAPDREPVYTEPSGGQGAPQYRISDLERRMAKTTGIGEKKWSDAAKDYRPGGINVLGD